MLKTTILKRGPYRHDISGQSLPRYLNELDEQISSGLARRLYRYAQDRLADAGFLGAVTCWTPEVSTLDGDKNPPDRAYVVRFKNPKGGYIAVVGILTSHGWPSLDHGFEIGHEEPE